MGEHYVGDESTRLSIFYENKSTGHIRCKCKSIEGSLETHSKLLTSGGD